MRTIAFLTLLPVFAGCVAQHTIMTESEYTGVSKLVAFSQKCFKEEYIDPELLADTTRAIGDFLATKNYDVDKLTFMSQFEYSGANADKENCRLVSAHSYQMINKANQYRADNEAKKLANARALENQNRNKPIFCNRIGSTTICN